MNIVGQRIKKVREEKGYSQLRMGERLGLTQSNYSRLEKDDKRLDIVRLFEIARILDVELMELLGAKAKDFAPEDRPLYELLVQSQKAEIDHLKEEIKFMRKLLKPGK